MKMFLTLALVLLAGTAQAYEWSDYQYLGNCVGTEDENSSAKFDFYAADLNLKKTTTGFVVATVTEQKETRILGGYDAKYSLNEEKTEMTVTVEDLDYVIPFGENGTVAMGNQKLVCNTNLPQ